MSRAPFLAPGVRQGLRLGHGQLLDSMIHDGLWDPFENWGMGNSAEFIAEEHEVTRQAMDEFAFHKGLMAVWNLISQMNRYIDVTAPWVLAKKKSTRKQLEAVLYYFLEGLRVISGLIYPVMPDTAGWRAGSGSAKGNDRKIRHADSSGVSTTTGHTGVVSTMPATVGSFPGSHVSMPPGVGDQ